MIDITGGLVVTTWRKLAYKCVPLLLAGACSAGRGVAPASAPVPAPAPSAAEMRTVASLPENPCELLTAGQVAAAAGIRVSRARRMPDIEEIISSQKEGRPARANLICSYETPSDLVAITIIVPPLSERTAAGYWKARETSFRQAQGQPIAGVGEDAWLGGGTVLHVLAGKNAHFTVATRMHQPRSREVVTSLARAVLEKLHR